MMHEIRLVSFDPALSNLGVALLRYNIFEQRLVLDRLHLAKTEPTKTKQVRKNSDDLERARILFRTMTEFSENRAFAIAEIPVGTQSARGAMSNGIALGVLAGCPVPLIQVTPTEAKLAGPGIKTATKQEMIEWAIAKYPHKDWLMRKSKGQLVPIADNEHLADAVAIAEAGIKTDQFKQALALYKAVHSFA